MLRRVPGVAIDGRIVLAIAGDRVVRIADTASFIGELLEYAMGCFAVVALAQHGKQIRDDQQSDLKGFSHSGSTHGASKFHKNLEPQGELLTTRDEA
jgi:hypothetical protein